MKRYLEQVPSIDKDPDLDYGEISEDYPDKIMPIKTRRKSLLSLLKEAIESSKKSRKK
ncbi:MAG: hypothetical protein KKH52_03750 [Nanoarchaeota archaeon]|nr:hypothetical protein [Nanoarchaeota archaeon]MBU1622752.1 hypothetical protein [Nanoarchaeota archaeon]MBU1974482.1 hypothetical protein [Nanoarchaeota archaeon]